MELVERIPVEKATFLKSIVFEDFQKLKKFKNKEEAKQNLNCWSIFAMESSRDMENANVSMVLPIKQHNVHQADGTVVDLYRDYQNKFVDF